MILSFFKYCLFGSVMLLVGQIPLGSGTVGSGFSHQVFSAGHWGMEKISHGSRFPTMSEFSSSFGHWWRGTPPKVAAVRRHTENTVKISKGPNDADSLTSADREALIQLLQ